MLQVVAPLFAVLFAGIGIAIETPTNALLAKTSGSVVTASLISFVIGTLVLAAIELALRPRFPTGWVAATPWYAWIGGVYGAGVVVASAWANPKLGAGTTLVVVVAAQVGLGVVLDHFGLLGLARHSLSWVRILGVVVVAVGALLVGLG